MPARPGLRPTRRFRSGSTHVHRGASRTPVRAPRDRAVERPIELVYTGAVAVGGQLLPGSRRQPLAGDLHQRARCDIASIMRADGSSSTHRSGLSVTISPPSARRCAASASAILCAPPRDIGQPETCASRPAPIRARRRRALERQHPVRRHAGQERPRAVSAEANPGQPAADQIARIPKRASAMGCGGNRSGPVAISPASARPSPSAA